MDSDVVHLHGATAGVLRYFSLGPAFVVNPHGMEEFESASLLRLPNRYFSRRMAREGALATRVLATDESLVETVVSNIGVARDRVVVIPNSVDLESLDLFRSGSGDEGVFTIVSIGRLVRNKGYDLLLDALKQSRVRESLPADWRWIHFGSGPESDRIRAGAKTHPSVPLEIRPERSDSEVQGSLSTADLFVQPSRYEGSSLTTLEAMAHGVTVVATAVGGIPDKIRDGETGFLASVPSSYGIADALIRATKSPPTVGVNARRLVRDRFGVEATSVAYLDLYSDLVKNRRDA